MKNVIVFVAVLFCIINDCIAQETVERSHRISDDITEKLHVLKSDKSTLQGLYQAFYDKNIAIASGQFNNNKKVGVWHFYDYKGQVLQNYDYTQKELLNEAPEDTTSNLRYFVDSQLSDTDRTTKPIRIGGRYYGYIPYLRLYKLPDNMMDMNRNTSYAVVELLVSPGGRLADYKVHIYSGNFQKTFNMSVNLPKEEDMVFTPATLNGEPISCRIMIKCWIDNDGHLSF